VCACAIAIVAMNRSKVRSDPPPIKISGQRIDINRAEVAELVLLPEIGPSLAQAIVADRRARGPFTDLDDLTRVRGIGPATIEAIRPHAIAGGQGGAGPRDDQKGP
jgi:competence ComEA-like helix-hairpin-helix protein